MDIVGIILLLVIITVIILLPSNGLPDRRAWWPTPQNKVLRMLEMANVQADEVLYDLGCGDGRVLIMAARRFQARAVA